MRKQAVQHYEASPKANISRLLSLIATPTFAAMALVTGFQDGAMAGMLCSSGQDPSLLTGMVPMYVLMSVFHSSPWLRLMANGRTGAWQA